MMETLVNDNSSKLNIALFCIGHNGYTLIKKLAVTMPNSHCHISLVITREPQCYERSGNPIISLCSSLGIPCYIYRNNNETLATLKSTPPDYIIVAGFHKILKNNIINAAKLGAYNIHPSLLPDLRGATPLVWALKYGLTTTGVTLHELTKDIDEGDIIYQEKVKISIWDNQETLGEKIAIKAHEILMKFIDDAIAGRCLKRIRQSHENASYLPKRTEEHGILDFRMNLSDLYNHIRSMDPKTGAFIQFNDTKVRLRRAIPVNYYIPSQVNGLSLIIGRDDDCQVKSIVINSVTDNIDAPSYFDTSLATQVLRVWNCVNYTKHEDLF